MRKSHKHKQTQKNCRRKFVAWGRFIASGMLVTLFVELHVHISKHNIRRENQILMDANRECNVTTMVLKKAFFFEY